MPKRSTAEELDPIPGHCEISTRNVDFEAEQLIYRQLIVEQDQDESYYKDIFIPRRHNGRSSGASFDALISQIARYGYSSFNEDPEEYHRLDLPVYKNSLILVQIPPDAPHWFIHPAVWLKEDSSNRCPSPDLYGQLRYVDAEGRSHRNPVRECRLIYFFAAHRPGDQDDPYIQSFLYEVYNAPRHLFAIDPDIRHPGNGSSPPEP